MSGLAWKLPLACVVALLAAATALTMRARMQALGPNPPPAVVHLGPDGLAIAKRNAAEAIDLKMLRGALQEFMNDEGRWPATLAELADHGYISKGYTGACAHFRYDPASGDVGCFAP